jgi:hypothetical protein
MFTLPVPEWELVMSKAVAAFCTFLVTGIACFLSTLIYAFIAHYRQFPDGVSRMFHDLLENRDPVSPSLIIRIVTVMAVVFQQLYLVYAVMTASQLVPRFRILAGFGVYIGVIVFVQQPLGRAINTLPLSGTPQLLVSACFAAILAALYFCCVNLLLKHRLNLE